MTARMVVMIWSIIAITLGSVEYDAAKTMIRKVLRQEKRRKDKRFNRRKVYHRWFDDSYYRMNESGRAIKRDWPTIDTFTESGQLYGISHRKVRKNRKAESPIIVDSFEYECSSLSEWIKDCSGPEDRFFGMIEWNVADKNLRLKGVVPDKHGHMRHIHWARIVKMHAKRYVTKTLYDEPRTEISVQAAYQTAVGRHVISVTIRLDRHNDGVERVSLDGCGDEGYTPVFFTMLHTAYKLYAAR